MFRVAIRVVTVKGSGFSLRGLLVGNHALGLGAYRLQSCGAKLPE